MSELEHGDLTSSRALRQLNLHRYALACDQIVGLDVLALGVGDGSGPSLLSTRAARVLSVDPDPARTAAAEGRLGGTSRLTFDTACPDALPVTADQFDAVIAFDLDWPGDPEPVLLEIRRVLKPDGFALLLGPPPAADGTDVLGSAVRHIFKHRFAMAQRIVAASAIGPAGRATQPNTADYRGYTTAPGAGLTAGVVRIENPTHLVWVVAERALPRADGAHSIFLDPAEDLWASMQQATTSADRNRSRGEPDMSVVAALIEPLLGAPVGPDLASLARALGQANVRLAVQDVKLADIARINEALDKADQEYRRLAERLDESRSDAAAARSLALENRTRAEQLTERLAQAERDADARRQVIDESHEHIQTLVLGLEQARRETEAASALAARFSEDLEQSKRDLLAAGDLAARLSEDLEESRSAGDIARETLARLEPEVESARQDARNARDLADRLSEALNLAQQEADAARRLAEEMDAERENASSDALAAANLAQQGQDRLESLRLDLEMAQDLLRATEDVSLQKADEAAQALALYNEVQTRNADLESRLQHALSVAEDARQAWAEQKAEAEAAMLEIERLSERASLARVERDAAFAELEVVHRAAEVEHVERQAILSEVETARLEARTALAEREAALAEITHARAGEAAALGERDALQADLQAVRSQSEVLFAQLEAAQEEARLERANAVAGVQKAVALATARNGDPGFAIGLRSRIQQAAVDEVSAYRAGFAAATTVRSARKELADRLAQVAGTASILPLASPPAQIRTGAARPASRKAQIKAAFRSGHKSAAPAAPLEAVAVLFDPDHYQAANPINLRAGETPFDHYVRSGRRKGFSPHPMIDADWIRNTWPDAVEHPFDLFTYINDVRLHDLWPNPLFEADHYRRMNRDVAELGVNPLAHYLLHGWREGRQPNQLFDNDWYLATHTDVLAAAANPLQHYLTYGATELRKPHPLFDHGFYLDRYPDVGASGMDAYAHFIAYGRGEGRLPCATMLDMQRLERFFDGATINDLMLLEEPETRLRRLDDDFWPPRPAGEYWLPQRLRDFIIDRFGEDQLQINAWLFSLIERFGNAPETFDTSAECEKLIARAKLLASTPISGRPVASIVIPVYNNLLYTLTCIVSVLESSPVSSFEIIVGDDGSTDRTAGAIAAIGGLVRHVRHARNLGFLGNCNTAAEKASGEYVVFLNNDTIVFPGWLDRLIEAMATDPSIGFIGSKLLNGDGSLQEAGGLFWKDGSAWNYGRDADPMAPEFNYLKDADYISGASIALPIKVWRRLGGFDAHFAPAYCEDSDLAFRVRQVGLRTVYHPHSALVHHEGRSHGRDVGSGVKAYQVINSQKFLTRWGATLLEENLPNGTDIFVARDRSRHRPHILVVDHYIPQWDQDAGSRTMFHFIRAFVNRGFQVTFWPDNLHEDREYAPQLQRMGVEVIYGYRHSGRFDAWLAENAKYLNYAFLSRPHISENYIGDIERAGLKVIYYGHDLHFLRALSSYALSGKQADLHEAEIWEAREVGISRRADVVMYPGHEEIEEMAKRLSPGARLIRPPITIFDESDLALAEIALDDAEADPYALMFVGGFGHTPNGDGVDWFLSDIWPRLRAADSRFTLRIGGSRMPDSLLNRIEPGVTMLGRLSEAQLTDLYRSSGLSIVPLRFGGGIKGKVIEAFARGTPVVMTEIGAQGLPDAAEMGFVAKADDSFVQAVLDAASNRADAVARARRALDFLRREYSEQAFCDLLESEVPELAGSAGAVE